MDSQRLTSQNADAPHKGRTTVTQKELAWANQLFDLFLNGTTLKTILGTYRTICEALHLKPNVLPHFYPKLRAHMITWRAKALWKKFDLRANNKVYGKGKLCPNTRVLIIGAGPCGLRTAIEAQLLGAKVVVIEKRDRMSRNNVLHLWPFVIDDLRSLGAKKFFGKFCAGAIDHISIRQLQCILLKVALLLGVEVHTEVSFERLVEPNPDEKTGWRAEFKPSDHPVSQFEFDVIIGADGKRNTLQGFRRKEFRGKLAIAITANFINKRTEAEARVEEISGVAFIFNQKFFKDLFAETGIDLENIVYYKDDTHYFVMTAKKASLIEKGVIRQDLPDTAKLLAQENVDREALMNYAREAAEFSTNYKMVDLEFAVNHYGQPDVAMFDFTSMYAAENASRLIERHGYKLLTILVGDSLLEPFWPTGSGCARGFLSSLDAAWAIRAYGSGMLSPLEVIAERESIYRLLAQTTPENLNKDYKGYTLDPSTRYPNLNKNLLTAAQMLSLYDTDDPKSIEITKTNLAANHHVIEAPKKRRRRDSNVDSETLIAWIKEQVKAHEDLAVDDITTSLKDGRVLCAIINHYRPDLLDYSAITADDPVRNNKLAFDILEKDIGIPPVMTGEEMSNSEVPDYLTMVSYLTLIYDTFRCEIPHIKHPKLEIAEPKHTVSAFTKNHPAIKSIIVQPTAAAPPSHTVHRPSSRHKRHSVEPPPALQKSASNERKPRKRKTMEKLSLTNVERENRAPPSAYNKNAGEKDEDFQARIKGIEEKWSETAPTEKKPKDLLRAIGKIDNSDWNIKEIEKKIHENKLVKVNRDKERVPKWSREQFLARQTKMEKQHLEKQDSTEAKYAEIDKNIKQLDQKLKEGTVRDLKQKKVAMITEKFVAKVEPEPKPVPKSNSKAVIIPTQGNSESCHFCAKRVYLMERLSAEGRFFHRGCFRCQYCHTALRLGSYLYDRDGKYGYRFYCSQHFGMSGELKMPAKVTRKPSQRRDGSGVSPEKKVLSGVAGVDLLDRVQTPERIEFANLSTGNASSDHDDSLSQMDEDEWTDRNFGASTAELGTSDDDSSSMSDTDSDDEDAFEEALDEPPTKEGTLKWAERFNKRYSKKHRGDDSDSEDYSSSDPSSYYENSSGDDDSDTATEGEEEIRARELRKQEVRVEPPVVHTDTGTDTEIASDETSTESSSEIQNSATEISTDSEFAHDDPTPTREVPSIVFNDAFVTKTRGKYSSAPQKVQIKTTEIQKPINTKPKNIELKFTPLVLTPIVRKPPPIHLQTEGYALNRTQSTGGIATKVSLELKKKYLLGESDSANMIQKSGSASTLDSKLKSFHSTISDCQKLLKPAAETTVFSNKPNERSSPVSPTLFSIQKIEEKKNEDNEVIPVPFENENEGRPRSPVHETSIIVPQIDWSQQQQQKLSTDSSDSSSESSSDSDVEKIAKSNSVKSFSAIPKLEVQDVDAKDLPIDSLNYEVNYKGNEVLKSICGERKTLNQPKKLPELRDDDCLLNQVHAVLHNKSNKTESVHKNESVVAKSKDVTESEYLKNRDNIGIEFSKNRDAVGKQVIKNKENLENKSVRSKDGIEIECSEKKDKIEYELSKSKDTIVGELTKSSRDAYESEVIKSKDKIEGGLLKEEVNVKVENENKNDLPKIAAEIGIEDSKFGYSEKTENITKIAKEIERQIKTVSPERKPLPDEPKTAETKIETAAKTPSQLSPYKSKPKLETERKLEDDRSGSGRSTPSNNDPITTVLTETELSDWAREGAVSDDLDDEFEPRQRHHKKPKTVRSKSKNEIGKASIAEFDELTKHVCGKARAKSEPLAECVNSVLYPDLDNIEFMDTGSETSEDEIAEVKNNGYVQFHDEEEMIEDSLSPVINVVEAKNPRIKATFDEDFDEPVSCSEIVKQKTGFKKIASDYSIKPGFCNEKSNVVKEQKPDYNDLSTVSKNTGYCIIGNENDNFGGEVIDLKPTDLERLREKRNQVENEEDSLLIIETRENVKDENIEIENLVIETGGNTNEENILTAETGGTTTEENTCSDSTVKNITVSKVETPQIVNNNTFDTKRLEDKLAQVKKDMKKLQEQRKAELTNKQQIAEQNLRNNIEFEQHCQRLQSRVDFGNARDSIDIRKSRRQSKGNSSPTHPKPDLIQEEKEPSPMQSRREQIEKERDLNKKLVQEMVMNKMKAQNKSLERKRRCRNSFSPARPNELTKSSTSDNVMQHLSNTTPDVLLNAIPVQKSQTVADFNKPVVLTEPKALPRAKYLNRPLSVHSGFLGDALGKKQEGGSEAFSLPDIQKALVMDQFQTPKVPPRLKNEEAKRVVEKLKEDARARAKLLSDEDLGLSPEDKLAKLRQRVNRRGKENEADLHVQDSIESLVMNTERRNSLLYANDTLKKKKNNSFRRSKSGEEYLNRANGGAQERERTKSVSDINRQVSLSRKEEHVEDQAKTRCFNKSDPNLLEEVEVVRREKKKPKDRERRKSITKMFTDLFSKKKDAVAVSPGNGNKGFLARISPKAKDKSKSCIDLRQRDSVVIKEEQPQRRMSFTELRRSVPGNVSPPPIPPLPLNYTGTKSIEDSSDGESDYKRIDRSSCDTLDQSGVQDGSICSRRSARSRRAARQSQLKRHRMAQEIQRKLEETEVKMRELELRGVRVEKALRGEGEADDTREETDMLKEWFDLMRDMTELKRYERELNVRAQELELEDRHARLQHDLKERLEIDGQKSREDIETEGSIIKEMMDIVRKRDSLIALLEEDRIRYSEEDRGFEEQMLAKGSICNLTPITTSKLTEK